MDTDTSIRDESATRIRKIDSNKIKTMADIRLLLKVLEIRVDDTHSSYEELIRLFEDEGGSDDR
tara:strand:+ start:1277 stop:1468 length:192 start_codon:yes stop_codon:yes gene_type:complete